MIKGFTYKFCYTIVDRIYGFDYHKIEGEVRPMKSETTNESSKKSNTLIVILLIIILLLLLCGGGILFFFLKGAGSSTSTDAAPTLSYETEGVTIVDDRDALQKAVDEMVSKVEEGAIALKYKQKAYSSDGKTFSCSIANSDRNTYDMFIGIYSDATLTEQLFLSGLIRPGEKFESLTLDKTLEPGTHSLVVAFTQVEADLQTMHSQTFVTVDFIVE